MTTNRWTVGLMYYNGLLNGQPFFTQAVPGGQVLPTQQNATPWEDYPIEGMVIQEYSPWFAPGCGHSIKMWKIIREFDYNTNSSVALICCEICSFVQNYHEPYESILDPIAYAVIVG